MSSEYIPLVSWETKLIDVQPVLAEPFHYTCKVSSINPNDYSPNTLGIDRFYVVDYTGKIYEITEIVDAPTQTIKIYDLLEDADEGPYISESAYVYQTRTGINVLTQAQRKRLHPSAMDQIWNIENNIIKTQYTFLNLTDTPNVYTDQKGFILKVNSEESALEFLDPSEDWLLQYALLAGRTGDILKIDELQEFNSGVGVKVDGLIIKDTGINFEVGATTRIFKDGSNNLSFTDAVTGTKTLAQLASTNATTITVADTTDTTCFIGLFESATGNLAPKTDGGLLYNATSQILSCGYLEFDGVNSKIYNTAVPTSFIYVGDDGLFEFNSTHPFGFYNDIDLKANDLLLTGSIASTGSRVTKGWFIDLDSNTFTINTGITPDVHDGAYLGTAALGFSDLYLATGAVITFGAASTPNMTLTHSADLLAFSKNISIVCGSDADGDIWYRSSGKFARLAKGTAGQVLKMNSDATAPEWGAGGSSQWTDTTGGIYYANNVGIGTTAPLKKLEVTGDIMAGVGYGIGFRYDGTTDPAFYNYITGSGANPLNLFGGLFTANGTTEGIRFSTQGGTAMSILNNKNVGIGTTSPDYKLDVNGHIAIEGVGNALYFDTTGIRATNYIKTTDDYAMTLYCGRGTTTKIVLNDNGPVELYYGGNKKLETTTNGIAVTGTLSLALGSDADGDIWYRSSGVFARLPKGTAGQVLKMKSDATAPEWGAASSGTVSFGTDYQIPIMNLTDDDFWYSPYFAWNGTTLLVDDSLGNVYIGQDSGKDTTTGVHNTCIGSDSGANITEAVGNVFIGSSAGSLTTEGGYNIFGGIQSGYYNTLGQYSVFIGFTSGFSNTSGDGNTFIGSLSGYTNTTGIANTYLGYYSGSGSTGSNNVFLGASSGMNETGSSKLFIDNQNRGSEANGRIQSLIYGEFNATPASQLFRVNGVLDHSLVPNKPKIYTQATEPNIPNDTMAFWKDSDDSKYYLILDIGGTQKKVELT